MLSNPASEIDSKKHDGRCEAGREYHEYEKIRNEFVFVVEILEVACLQEGDAGKCKEHEGTQGERNVKRSFQFIFRLCDFFKPGEIELGVDFQMFSDEQLNVSQFFFRVGFESESEIRRCI